MESGLSHTGDSVGILDSVEAGHRPGVVEDDGAIIVCHGEDISVFRIIEGDNKPV